LSDLRKVVIGVFERFLRLASTRAALLAISLGLGSAGASANAPNDFVYQLRRFDLEAIGETKFDLVIMDYFRDGSDERKFTAAQISALKNSSGGPKTVLYYMSIGGAEDYRWYWQHSWDADRDGRPDTDASAEAEMMNFVKDIANYARVTHNHPGFQIFVQNAEELSRHPDYVPTVSGIGKEDPFYHGNRRQPADEVKWSVKQLGHFNEAGKPILVSRLSHRARKDRRLLREGSRARVRLLRHAPSTSHHHKPRPRAGLSNGQLSAEC
jgi:endo-alpha-1,4-polygalactosaminidase (GH114 family)